MRTIGHFTSTESGRHYVMIIVQYGELFEIILKFCNMYRNLFLYLFIELLFGNKDEYSKFTSLNTKPSSSQ